MRWKKNIKENVKENIMMFSLLFSLKNNEEKRREKWGKILSGSWYVVTEHLLPLSHPSLVSSSTLAFSSVSNCSSSATVGLRQAISSAAAWI